MTARERLSAFVEAERGRVDTRRTNILWTATAQVINPLAYVEITANEYDEAAVVFLANAERKREAFTRGGEGSRALTQEELDLLDEGAHVSLENGTASTQSEVEKAGATEHRR